MAYIYINPVVRDSGGGDDPWAAFLSPDSTASALTRNDPAPIEAPRVPIPSTPRVWGDNEAEAAGLYEPKKVKTESFKRPDADPWAAFVAKPPQQPPTQEPRAPYEPPATFEGRLGEMDQRPEMKSAFGQRALEMTQGPPTDTDQYDAAAKNMDISQSNYLAAASQGTSPNISDYGGKLVSKEAFEGDDGGIYYRDPSTGKVVPTNPKKQVAIRDPADGRVKIFDRSEDTNEGFLTGLGRILAPGLLAGAPTARAPGIVTQRGIKPGMVTSGDVLKTAEPHYQTFDSIAAATPVPNRTADRIKGAIEAAGQSQQNASPVYGSVDNMVAVRQGPSLTLKDLRDLKEQLGRNFAKSGEARFRDAARAASDEISKIIGEYAPNEASTALETANAIHAAGKSLEKVEQLGNVAKTTAAQKTLGQSSNEVLRGDLGNIIKQLAAKRKPGFSGSFMGFKPNELDAIRDIAEGRNFIEQGIRTTASMAPEKGVLRSMFAVGHVGYTGGATAFIPALGSASDILARVLDAGQVNRLKDLLAKRSPEYAEAVKNAVDRLQRAQEALNGNPTPKTFAAYVAASRSVAAGLTRDGIQISSGDFIRLLGGPVKSAADNEQGD